MWMDLWIPSFLFVSDPNRRVGAMRIEATLWEKNESGETKGKNPEIMTLVPLADSDNVLITIGVEDPEDPYSAKAISVSRRELMKALEHVGWVGDEAPSATAKGAKSS